MKKLFILLTLVISFNSVLLFSQKPLEETKREFKYTMVSSKGTNASAVVWHPQKSLYFTIIAGNTEYPLEAFDNTGKSVYSQEIQIDSRGMWYNKSKKCLEINGANDYGWASIKLDKKMTSHQIENIITGKYQPEFQSVGTFNPVKKCVVFLNAEDGTIELYNYKKPAIKETIQLTFNTGSIYDCNQTTIGFTGKKGYEYVLLDIENNKLIYFNTEGKETASSSLPFDAVTNELFRFSYTNDRVFLYDVATRTWSAYKVF